MSCHFKIDFPGLAKEHIETAKTAIIKHGGKVVEKPNGGSFELSIGLGKIAGTYAIAGGEVTFNIDKKPFLIPCSVIEKEIKKYAGMGQ